MGASDNRMTFERLQRITLVTQEKLLDKKSYW
jgi:hypothetical protein